MIKNIFIYLLDLVLECGLVIWFLYNVGSNKYLIIPIIAVSILIISTIICFIKTVFIGRKYLKIEDDKLLIKQKEKIIASINKNELEKLVVIFDIFSDHIDFIKFRYNNKKYSFQIPREIETELKTFVSDLNYKRKTDLLLEIINLIAMYFYHS